MSTGHSQEPQNEMHRLTNLKDVQVDHAVHAAAGLEGGFIISDSCLRSPSPWIIYPEVGSRHQTVSLSIPGLRGLSGLSPMDYIFYSDNLKR
jgi:hypothetical protein